jgi:hypothetical protein
MVPSLTGSEADKRNAMRHHLRLPGRYMLVDRTEWECETVDISLNGVMLVGSARPYVGQIVVVYLKELGRLEGTVARLRATEFALEFRATERKREQLAIALAKIAEGESVAPRLDPAILSAVARHASTPLPVPASAPTQTQNLQPRHSGTPHEAFRKYLEAL